MPMRLGRSWSSDPRSRGQDAVGDVPVAVVVDATAGDDSSGDGDDRDLVYVGLESNHDPDSSGHGSFPIDFGDDFGTDMTRFPLAMPASTYSASARPPLTSTIPASTSPPSPPHPTRPWRRTRA